MRLRTARASPFGRKVWIALMRLGLMAQVELVEADFLREDDPLHQETPLGKMPVLTTDESEHLYDSRVILDHLDYLVAGVLMPGIWTQRLRNLRWQALCDGIMDAGALIVMEQRLRPPERRHLPFVEFQRGKIIRGLRALEHDAPAPDIVHVGAISFACALGFLDRRKQFDWRSAHPRLCDWLARFQQAAPEFDSTHTAPDPAYESL